MDITNKSEPMSFNSYRHQKIGGLLKVAFSGDIDNFLKKSSQFILFIRKAQKFILYNEIHPITPDKVITYQTEELEKMAYLFLTGLYQVFNQYFTCHGNKEETCKFAMSIGFDTAEDFQNELNKLISEGSTLLGIKRN